MNPIASLRKWHNKAQKSQPSPEPNPGPSYREAIGAFQRDSLRLQERDNAPSAYEVCKERVNNLFSYGSIAGAVASAAAISSGPISTFDDIKDQNPTLGEVDMPGAGFLKSTSKGFELSVQDDAKPSLTGSSLFPTPIELGRSRQTYRVDERAGTIFVENQVEADRGPVFSGSRLESTSYKENYVLDTNSGEVLNYRKEIGPIAEDEWLIR